MGCKAPNRTSLWTFVPDPVQPTAPMLSENVECYVARAGVKDDAGYAGAIEPKQDAITVTTIVPDCDMNVDQLFTVTGPKVATRWFQHTFATGDGVMDPAYPISGVQFINNGATARFVGKFHPGHSGKSFEFYVTAMAGSSKIDTRHYVIVPQICNKSTDIKFTHPLPGSRVTSVYGLRKEPCKGCSNDHKGLDFAYAGGKVGDVLAAADGEVVFKGVQRGYGNIVILQHKNGAGQVMCETRYAHLDSMYVELGQKIPGGTKIGKEGSTGVGTGKHLHFEIRAAGNAIDPAKYLSGELQVSKASKGEEVYNANAPPAQQVHKSDPGTPDDRHPVTTVTNNNVALTVSKVNLGTNRCPLEQIEYGQQYSPTLGELTPVMSIPTHAGACSQKPDPAYPDINALMAAINGVLNSYPDLDADDKSYIKFTAQIESGYNRHATNKTPSNPNGSSATGLYQFLDELAYAYYGGDGEPIRSDPDARAQKKRPPGYAAPPALKNIPPTCENRCNPVYATHAMVAFYRNEVRKYYIDWIASGKTRIAGTQVNQSSTHIQNLQYATKAEFCYAVHHEGPSKLASGTTSAGITYFRREAKKNNYTA